MNEFLLTMMLAVGQCGPNGCPAPTTPVTQKPGYEWKEVKDRPEVVGLIQNGVQIGAWDYERRVYYPYNASTRTFGVANTVPPTEPPSRDQQWQRFGVDRSECSKAPRYSVSGTPVDQDRAYESLTENNLVDDSTKFHITFIDNKREDAEKRMKEFIASPSTDTFRDRVHFQAYPTGDAMLRSGVPVDKLPTIPTVLVSTKERVLLREDNYSTAEAFAEKIRAVDPKYDPAKDPTGVDWMTKLKEYLKNFQTKDYLIAAIVFVVAVLLKRKPQPTPSPTV